MDYVKYILLYSGILFVVWGLGTVFASTVSDYEVIKPKEDVECIVVSRMFNTSVDCWKER